MFVFEFDGYLLAEMPGQDAARPTGDLYRMLFDLLGQGIIPKLQNTTNNTGFRLSATGLEYSMGQLQGRAWYNPRCCLRKADSDRMKSFDFFGVNRGQIWTWD